MPDFVSDGSSLTLCDTPRKRQAHYGRPRNALTIKQRLFIDAYLSTNMDGLAAYLQLHPKATRDTAKVAASRWLALEKVQAEIAQRVRYACGITKAQIEADLLWAKDMAKSNADYQALASISMDCAKLGGFLVEKREVKTVSDEEKDVMRRVVNEALVGTGTKN